jgi:hypothetical protein
MTETVPLTGRARALRDATPASRDRYADLLRLYSIAMVALGHWVAALLTVNGPGRVSPALGLLTWGWQVMALFFFVGGFGHARALRHDPPYGRFLRARTGRLLPPVAAMLTVWTALATLAGPAGLSEGVFATGLHMITVPLWFLGVYLMIVLLAPPMMALHRRFGLARVLGVLTSAAAVTDLLTRGAGLHPLGYANLLFVWLAVHQLGYGYADGTLVRGGRRLAAALAGGGLAATVLLVFGTGWYPVQMVGLPGDPVSNSSPPTLALLAHAVFLVGCALLLRPAGTALAGRPGAWLVVALGNSVIMTVFCWHLSACYLVQGALLATGTALPAPGSPAWVGVLAGWLPACAAVCAVLVRVFRRFERPAPAAGGGTPTMVAGVLACGTGLYAVSATGLDRLGTDPLSAAALPTLGAVGLVVLGVGLTRCPGALTILRYRCRNAAALFDAQVSAPQPHTRRSP